MNEAENDVQNSPDTPEDKDFPLPEGLTETYQGDYIVLMPRDPEWLHAYWVIPGERIDAAFDELGVPAGEAELQLRLHNVTDLIEAGSGRPRLEDSADFASIKIDASADHWYIKAGGPEQLYCVEYVVAAPDGRAVKLALSNLAATPGDRVVAAGEETWVTASVENGQVAKTRGPAETKWMKGHEGMHEALSSSGSARMPAEEQAPEPQT